MPGILQAFSDYLITLAGGLATIAIGYARRVDRRSRDALDKAERNDLLLTGDDDDPNIEGVLKIAHETRSEVQEMRSEVQEMRREMATEHREVMDKMDALDDES